MSDVSDSLFGIDVAKLSKVSPRELAIRFAFGAGISVVSGSSGIVLGSIVGGMLLAFPAIAPATLTLIEKKDGNTAAVHDVGGAVFGGIGLVAFALVGAYLFQRLPDPVVLLSCLAAWSAVSVGVYVLRSENLLSLPAVVQGRLPGCRRSDPDAPGRQGPPR